MAWRPGEDASLEPSQAPSACAPFFASLSVCSSSPSYWRSISSAWSRCYAAGNPRPRRSTTRWSPRCSRRRPNPSANLVGYRASSDTLRIIDRLLPFAFDSLLEPTRMSPLSLSHLDYLSLKHIIREVYHTLKSHLGSRSLWYIFRSSGGNRRRVHVRRGRWHRGPRRARCGSRDRHSPRVEGRRRRSPGVPSRRTTDDLETRRRYRREGAAVARRIQVAGQTAVAGTRQTGPGIAARPVSRGGAQGLASVDFRCTKPTAARIEACLKKKREVHPSTLL